MKRVPCEIEWYSSGESKMLFVTCPLCHYKNILYPYEISCEDNCTYCGETFKIILNCEIWVEVD